MRGNGNLAQFLEVGMTLGRPESRKEANPYMSKAVGAVVMFLVLLFAAGGASAQVLYGSITGTVTDKSGAVIPNFAVSITN